ncbi:DNA-protecting protein DprA [Duganella sp. FT92W]|uniref:DNA-protecting protein DprA n=1 Tax=Pseudoduganella rivuli TaxID=2666085 RepID=A0A7X2LS84_9BURK|nr:DNA-processing protein DprA [Pseudoduganella rivuli]MRV73245.1 DNA-protecting protein DprA [Pseudoduganella rivuli]
MPGSQRDAAAWLRLAETPHVGPVAAKALLDQQADPAAIFSTAPETLAEWLADVLPACHLDAAVNALHNPRPDWLDQLARMTDEALAWARQPGCSLMVAGDADYPPLLKEIADPPVLLYIEGDRSLLGRPAVGVVGARNASAQGVAHAEQFARGISEAGLVVVSGLALGIDAAAHRGGLAGQGSTVAVIGAGIDLAYPRRNLDLMQRIAEQGCIVSEYPLGTPPRPDHFPKRNRILSGLSRGVLVVEAAEKSGSLITAKLAAEQGRDVMAIPGSIHSPLAHGCHELLRKGAILVESVAHVLDVVQPGMHGCAESSRAQRSAAVHGQLAELLVALGHDPAPAEALAQRAGLPLPDTQGHLLALELAGLIERLPGGIYQRLQN